MTSDRLICLFIYLLLCTSCVFVIHILVFASNASICMTKWFLRRSSDWTEPCLSRQFSPDHSPAHVIHIPAFVSNASVFMTRALLSHSYLLCCAGWDLYDRFPVSQ
jgi:hypothetical protein